jgi:hypothetical protein
MPPALDDPTDEKVDRERRHPNGRAGDQRNEAGCHGSETCVYPLQDVHRIHLLVIFVF